MSRGAPVVLVVMALLLGGCAGEAVRLGGKLPRGASLADAREVTAKGCGFQLMLLIPIMINDRQKRAYESLLAQAGRDVLTDVEVEESWSYAFVGTVYCTRMRAKAVPTQVPPAAAPSPPAPAPQPAPAISEPPVSPPPPPAVIEPEVPAPAAPVTPAAAVPPPPAVPAPPPTLGAGVRAVLRPDGVVRTRATAEGAVVPSLVAGTAVTLKASVRNAAGTWWYVTSPSGSGWVAEAHLEAAGP